MSGYPPYPSGPAAGSAPYPQQAGHQPYPVPPPAAGFNMQTQQQGPGFASPQQPGYPPPYPGQQHVTPTSGQQQWGGAGTGHSGTPAYPTDITGYENVSFSGGLVPPPPAPVASAPPEDIAPVTVDTRPMSEGEVKEHLAGFVAQHCCYGSKPIRAMRIVDIVPTSTFKYSLDSFIERRETKWKFVPWDGNSLPTSGTVPPGPWEIPASPKEPFTKETREMCVPHTDSVKPCHDCHGHGDKRCEHCAGRGRDQCVVCSGSGVRMQERCFRCDGVGSVDCIRCHKRGMIQCPTCKGKRNLHFFVGLTINWEVKEDKYVVETATGLPDEQVAQVSGETVFQDERPWVWPIPSFPDQRVARASEQLVKKHHTGWPMARLLQQRHDVQRVPIYRVSYFLDGNNGNFFIIGFENRVYFPDYPSQCCGCCTVL